MDEKGTILHSPDLIRMREDFSAVRISDNRNQGNNWIFLQSVWKNT